MNFIKNKKIFLLFLALLFTLTMFFNNVQAAYPSQCQGTSSQTQTNCTNDYDNAILSEQCAAFYAPVYCTSMQDYLDQMMYDCSQTNPSGIDCATIAAGGFYGKEASSYASYVEDSENSINNIAQEPGSGIPLPTGFGLPDPVGGIKQILESVLYWILGIVGVIGMIAFVISGLQYFFAAGNENTAEIAKRNMTYAIIGIIVALSGFIIIRAIDYALNAYTFF